MKSIWQFIKTTVIGGLLFLVPVVILIVVLGQAFGLMLQVAEPLGELIPIDNIGDIALVNILVVVLILIVCFIAGLFATRSVFTRFQDFIETKLLMKIPGYSMIKGVTHSIKTSEEASENFIPVRVKIADFEQLGFEIERIGENTVVVFLPGAPNPWAGQIVYTRPDKITALPISVPDALGLMEQLGMGSEKIYS